MATQAELMAMMMQGGGLTPPPPGAVSYAGADTETKRVALMWTTRASAILSAACSLFLLCHIYIFGQKTTQQQQQQQRQGRHTAASGSSVPVRLHLVACIALFDMIASAALAFGSMPLPETVNGRDNIILGARGTDATCKVQGFFVQWGFVSDHFYFLCLSTYYLLVVKYGWTETQVEKLIRYFPVPALASLAFAIAGLNHYESSPLGCYIPIGPRNPIKYLLIFNIIPLWIALLLAFVNLFRVYRSVRKREQVSQRWRISGYAGASTRSATSTAPSSSLAIRSAATTTTATTTQPAASSSSAGGSAGESSSQEASLPVTTATEAASEAFQCVADEPQPPEQPTRAPPTPTPPPTRPLQRTASSLSRAQTQVERAVFWQCLSYFLAYFIPALFMSFSQMASAWETGDGFYWCNLFSFSIGFSLGAFNLLVYIRPLLFPAIKRPARRSTPGVDRSAARQKQQAAPSSSSASGGDCKITAASLALKDRSSSSTRGSTSNTESSNNTMVAETPAVVPVDNENDNNDEEKDARRQLKWSDEEEQRQEEEA